MGIRYEGVIGPEGELKVSPSSCANWSGMIVRILLLERMILRVCSQSGTFGIAPTLKSSRPGDEEEEGDEGRGSSSITPNALC